MHNDGQPKPRYPRRTVLAAGTGLVAAAAATACGGKSAGNAPKADAKRLVVPDFVAPESIPGSRISTLQGVSPAYTKYPSSARRSVSAKPGKGGTVRSFVPSWSVAPPPPRQNRWAQELSRRLGVTYSPTVAVGGDYDTKVATTIAGGDMPDLLFAITANPVVLQTLLQGGLTDLTPHLAGDKIKKYPNLERLPSYAWTSCAVENTLYGAPNTLSFINQFDIYRRDWAKLLGHTDLPSNGDDMFAMLSDFAQHPPTHDAWVFGSVTRGVEIAQEMYRVPTNWRKNKDGSLTHYIETDEFEGALAYANKLWKAKCYHPDALSNNDTKDQELFATGHLFLHWSSFDVYFGNGKESGILGQLGNVKGADPQHFLPPGHDGGKPNPSGSSPGSYGVAAIPSSVGKDSGRVEELLNIMNYWAAPFGTEEYLFIHFGIEGYHYTLDAAKQPIPVNNPDRLSELAMNVMCGPAIQYYPANPPIAITAQKIIETNAPLVMPDPTVGLVSQTWIRKSPSLTTMITDYTNQIVSGRKPVSAVKELRRKWQDQGGNTSRSEYEESARRASKRSPTSPTATK